MPSPKHLIRVHRSDAIHWVGDGFPVRSIFGYTDLGRYLSPFLLLDYAAPHEFPPDGKRRGVGAHPHRGFETVTVVYQGELEHRDSSGAGGTIGPGDVQWMTAASGIVHEEFHSGDFSRAGGTLEMVQLWVNLRAVDKRRPPAYQTIRNADIPVVRAGQSQLRLIAGEFAGAQGPARTFSPMKVWDASVPAGERLALDLPAGDTTAFLVLRGEVAAAGQSAGPAAFLIYDRAGETIDIKAQSAARLLLLSGQPIDEPVVGHGPFVMNSEEEIRHAFDDYRAGRMGSL
jgi:hypothetical protein